MEFCYIDVVKILVVFIIVFVVVLDGYICWVIVCLLLEFGLIIVGEIGDWLGLLVVGVWCYLDVLIEVGDVEVLVVVLW